MKFKLLTTGVLVCLALYPQGLLAEETADPVVPPASVGAGEMVGRIVAFSQATQSGERMAKAEVVSSVTAPRPTYFYVGFCESRENARTECTSMPADLNIGETLEVSGSGHLFETGEYIFSKVTYVRRAELAKVTMWPPAVVFPTTRLGDRSDALITLQNVGKVPTTIRLNSDSIDSFKVVKNNCGPLMPGRSCQITVRFSPTRQSSEMSRAVLPIGVNGKQPDLKLVMLGGSWLPYRPVVIKEGEVHLATALGWRADLATIAPNHHLLVLNLDSSRYRLNFLKTCSAPTSAMTLDPLDAGLCKITPIQGRVRFIDPSRAKEMFSYQVSSGPPAQGKLHFESRIAPFLDAACKQCHTDGNILPFNLTKYGGALDLLSINHSSNNLTELATTNRLYQKLSDGHGSAGTYACMSEGSHPTLCKDMVKWWNLEFGNR